MAIRWIIVVLLMAVTGATHHAQAADSTGVTKNTIKIGMFGAITSANGVFAKGLYGAAAIYKDVNDRGGINGRKLELVIEDDACDPDKTVSVVNKLIDQDKVFMLHGGWCSTAVMKARPEIVKRANVPYMNLASASAAISTPLAANIFQPAPTSKTIADTLVNFAFTKPGVKKVALVTQPDEGPNSKIRAAAEKLKTMGIEPVAYITLEKGATDTMAQVRELKAKAPDVVLVSLYPTEISALLRDSYKEGFKTTFVSTESSSFEDTDKRVGIPEAMKDVYFFYPFTDLLTSPKLSKYAKIASKYYPNEVLDMISFQGMTGALAVVETLKRLGPKVSREAFLKELEKLNNFDGGIQPPLTFSKTQHAGAQSGNMLTKRGMRLMVVSKYQPPLGAQRAQKESQ
jgi:branched-chain amino acid transport system substrate-binding protein